MPPPTALVTGAGRGIGRATVLGFLAAGWRVVAGVRDPGSGREAYGARDGVLVVPLDVTDRAAVAAAAAAAEEWADGPLACLVSNAGYGLVGAQEDADLDEVRAMLETNLIGAAAMTQAVLPAMRRAGRGVVVNVSSIGGRTVNPLLGFYHATKYGMTALAEALALECRPCGVRVALVEPGMVATDFPLAARRTGALARGEGPYAPLARMLREGFERWRADHEIPAEAVAEAVLRAATDPTAPFRLPFGRDAEELARMRATCDDGAWQDRLVAFIGLDWPRAASG